MRQSEQLSTLMREINAANGGRSSWVLALVGSLGDAVFTASLLPAFRARYPGPLTVIRHPGHGKVLDALSLKPEFQYMQDLTRFAEVNHEKIQVLSDIFAPGVPVFCLPYFFGNMWRACVAGELKVISLFKELLRLTPQDHVSYFEAATVSPSPGRRPRVLLSPLTRTNPTAGHGYWNKLAEKLFEAGVDADINLHGLPEGDAAESLYLSGRIIRMSIDDWFATSNGYAALLGHPTGLGVLQSMTTGTAPHLWVVNYDPAKPFFLEPGHNILHSTRLQDFVYQGIEEQRPMYQVNAWECPAADLAKITLEAIDDARAIVAAGHR